MEETPTEWNIWKKEQNMIQRKNIDIVEVCKRKVWMTIEIFDLMETRRKKERKTDEYRSLYQALHEKFEKQKKTCWKKSAMKWKSYKRNTILLMFIKYLRSSL